MERLKQRRLLPSAGGASPNGRGSRKGYPEGKTGDGGRGGETKVGHFGTGGSSRYSTNSLGNSLGSDDATDNEKETTHTNPMMAAAHGGQGLRRLNAHSSVLF